MRTLAILTVVASLSSAASAQVVYAPPVTQFGGANPYGYIGELNGDSPCLREAVDYPSLPGASWGRINGYDYISSRRLVVARQPRLLADYLGPHGNPITDLTVADLDNAANARVPRYFTKAQAIADAQGASADDSSDAAMPPQHTGSIIIIVHRNGTRPATTQPSR